MPFLIVPAGFPSETATELAVANGCAGFYTGIPPMWVTISENQSWTLPCVVTEDEDGNVVSWFPAGV